MSAGASLEENPDDQRGFEEGEKQQARGLHGEGETPVVFPQQGMDEAVEEAKTDSSGKLEYEGLPMTHAYSMFAGQDLERT